MADFGILNWIIIIAYMSGNLWLGYKMSGRIQSAEQYYIGDKSAPWWAIGISVMATYVSALSFLGGRHGLTGTVWRHLRFISNML